MRDFCDFATVFNVNNERTPNIHPQRLRRTANVSLQVYQCGLCESLIVSVIIVRSLRNVWHQAKLPYIRQQIRRWQWPNERWSMGCFVRSCLGYGFKSKVLREQWWAHQCLTPCCLTWKESTSWVWLNDFLKEIAFCTVTNYAGIRFHTAVTH